MYGYLNIFSPLYNTRKTLIFVWFFRSNQCSYWIQFCWYFGKIIENIKDFTFECVWVFYLWTKLGTSVDISNWRKFGIAMTKSTWTYIENEENGNNFLENSCFCVETTLKSREAILIYNKTWQLSSLWNWNHSNDEGKCPDWLNMDNTNESTSSSLWIKIYFPLIFHSIFEFLFIGH